MAEVGQSPTWALASPQKKMGHPAALRVRVAEISFQYAVASCRGLPECGARPVTMTHFQELKLTLTMSKFGQDCTIRMCSFLMQGPW